MPKPPSNLNQFSSLVQIVKDLRGPDGCPWDKEQTHQTLTQYAIEEVYELAEAIDKNQTPSIRDELGDLLLQVVLHSEIARQNGNFEIADVIQSISEKMVRRHPHVFSDVKAESVDQVWQNWQQIKSNEKPKTEKENQFDIPNTLPALIKAQKIGNKTRAQNFDWKRVQEVIEKVEEELQELKEAIQSSSAQEQQSELGDLLFSIVQVARHLGFDAEQALRQTNSRFESRFFKMKELIEIDQKKMETLPQTELESYWQKAKIALKNQT